MEKPIKFSPLKIKIKLCLMLLLMELILLYFLRFWDSLPWFIKGIHLFFVIGIPYFWYKAVSKLNKVRDFLLNILPELEEGVLLPSDVDYIDEKLQIFIYDHYIIGYGLGDCKDMYDIKVVKVPHPKRDRNRDGIWGYLNSGEGFEIRSIGSSSKQRLYRIANYLHDNFDTPIEMYN